MKINVLQEPFFLLLCQNMSKGFEKIIDQNICDLVNKIDAQTLWNGLIGLGLYTLGEAKDIQVCILMILSIFSFIILCENIKCKFRCFCYAAFLFNVQIASFFILSMCGAITAEILKVFYYLLSNKIKT